MYRLILIDDEYYFRQSMKVKLPWSELGFEICGEANNGEDGLKLVEQLKPDAILLDINMPLMDGLEFCRSLKEMDLKAPPKIVILSGYNDFAYAKSAIAYGVNDYLLKPIQSEELAATIVEIKKQLDESAVSLRRLQSLELQLLQNKPLLLEKAFHDLLTRSPLLNESRLMEISEVLGLPPYDRCYRVTVLDIDDPEEKGWTGSDKELWRLSVANIASDTMNPTFSFLHGYDELEKLCCIFHYAEADQERLESILLHRLDQLRHNVRKFLRFTLTIGIGNAYACLDEISTSYSEALHAVRSKLIHGNDSAILYRELENVHPMKALFSVEIKTKLLLALRVNDQAEVQRLLDSLFQSFGDNKIPADLVYAHCIEMFALIMEYAAENNVDYRDLYTSDLDPFAEIYSKNKMQDLNAWMQQTYEQAAAYVHANKRTKSAQLVAMIKAYIEAHYPDSGLSIERLSQHFYVSYFHICHVFKQVTGSTLNKYISSYRLHKAKELLDSGIHSISHIANKVGYEDPNYFSKQFKKTFGVSPNQYLEKK